MARSLDKWRSSSGRSHSETHLNRKKRSDIVTRDDKTDQFVSACGMQNLKLTNENMGNMNGILKCSVLETSS